MRRLCGLLLALVLVGDAAADDTKAFFNGQNFDGWKGLIDEYWSVKDGAIVGKTNGLKFNTFLCSDKTYGDFELTFQVKLTNGNSGVQIRSKIEDPKKYVVAGPQCDMGAQYWGSLYGERFGGMMKAADPDLAKKLTKQNEFNDYSIKAVGKRITIKLNGETTVDQEFEKAPDTGIIAFQLHAGGPMEVVFRNIQFKNLSSK